MDTGARFALTPRVGEFPSWVWKAVAASAGLVLLITLVRNLRSLAFGGWSEYRRSLFEIHADTWWLIGFFVVSVLVILALWAFPLGGILVAG
jgi:hypothetical protein